VRLFQQAAEFGDGRAAYDMGFSREYGEGITQSDREAFAWYRLAMTSAAPRNVLEAARLGVDRLARRVDADDREAAEEFAPAIRNRRASGSSGR
jgi:hypothetical protein